MGLRMRPLGSPDSGGGTQQVNCPRCEATIDAREGVSRVRCGGCGNEVAVKRLKMPAMPIDSGGEEVIRLHDVVGRGPRPPREPADAGRPRVPMLAQTRSEAPRDHISRPSPATSVQPLETAFVQPGKGAPASASPEVPPRNRRWTFALLALLVLAVVIGYLLTRSRWS